jgi:hypothetical protein
MPTCSTNAAVTGWPGKNCLMTSGRRSPAISGRSTVLLKTFDLDSAIAKDTVDDPTVQRLLTIAGVNAIVASGIIAAIGDISRFGELQKLVSYFGLNPRVRQSGLGLAQHGRISKHGRSHARALLVEAAWAAAKAPGPLRAFFLRIRNKRGHQVAAVATARKLTVLIWPLLTKEQDYLWLRPSVVAAKRRQLALKAGAPSEKGMGRRGSATISRNCETTSGRERSRPRRLTSTLFGNGNRAGQSARTPQTRNGHEGGVAELASSGSALCHVVARARRK